MNTKNKVLGELLFETNELIDYMLDAIDNKTDKRECQTNWNEILRDFKMAIRTKNQKS